jgi:uncharacterized protein (TIRG00374 family)
VGSAPAGENVERRGVLRRAVRPVVGLLLGATAFSVVVGRRGELGGGLPLLGELRWPWLALAVVAEAGSVAAYAGLQRRLFRAGRLSLSLRSVAAIGLAGNAIQSSLPGGPAWAAMFGFGQFRRRGADAVLAAWVLVATGLVQAATLVGLAVVGVVLAERRAAANHLVGVILAVTLVALAAPVAVRIGLTTRALPRAAVRLVGLSQRLLSRPAGDPSVLVEQAWSRLGAVRPDAGDWTVAAAWGIANWLLDCGCLTFAFLAVGVVVPWRGLPLAYGAGMLAANLPVTPGGLGVVEGSLTIALVVYGGAPATIVPAVVLYRILSFWALLGVGWTSWLILTWHARREQRDEGGGGPRPARVVPGRRPG